jgi:uncharacterized protein
LGRVGSPVVVGRVAALHRYPVKSMLGEQPAEVELAAGGVVGDRAHALVDEETGKVVSVKRPRRWGRIFELRATSDEGVRFPDGSLVALDDPALDGALSDFLGRRVRVAASPPPGATFDEAWVRHLKEDVEPYFGQPSRTEDADGGEGEGEGEGELIDAGAFMSVQGNFFNFGAVHLVTTGTTRRLAELAPGSRFDAHRFRPNVVIDTGDGPADFVETGWQSQVLEIGSAVRLALTFTVPRCVMTTLAQDDLPADTDVLRTITAHNAVDVFGTGVRYPCVGIYADVARTGTVRVGDEVRLLAP